jgi:trehalose 6-phosphate phosphatase
MSEAVREAPELLDATTLARRMAERIGGRSDTRTRPLIALDHDGTLSPIAPRPEEARLAPGADAALRELWAVADVAIVSGRGLDDLADRFIDMPVELVAEHGLRHRSSDGVITMLCPGLDDATLTSLRARLSELLDASRERDGWLVEDKGVSVAVHHRLVRADALEPTLTRVHDLLLDAARSGGHVQHGRSVLELRPEGAEKGAALRALHAARPGALVMMVGDDVTDESALAYAESTGGLGVLVAEEPRSSAASVRVIDPDAVVRLLVELAQALRPG